MVKCMLNRLKEQIYQFYIKKSIFQNVNSLLYFFNIKYIFTQLIYNHKHQTHEKIFNFNDACCYYRSKL